jgi:nitrite reductase/ring-hydroxylating ferredoxin subunit
MFKKSLPAVVFLLISFSILAVSACSSQASAANRANSIIAKQSTIEAQMNSNVVSIAVSDVEKYTNTRFLVNAATDPMSFMAYKYNNQLYVRADICPPCGSESFTLKNGTLVCDSCGTVFNAKTGSGIKGACVKFTKQAVAFEIKDGNINLNSLDLTTAFQNTLTPKK